MNGLRAKRIRNALAGLALVTMLAVAGTNAVLAATQTKDGDIAPVDLNSATREQLMKVKGIGPSLADRIIDFRKQHGPYRRVEDILKVRGVGEKSLSKLRPYLKVNKTGA